MSLGENGNVIGDDNDTTGKTDESTGVSVEVIPWDVILNRSQV